MIAFMQWRQFFSKGRLNNKQTQPKINNEELALLIKNVTDHISTKYQHLKTSFKIKSKTALYGNFYPMKELSKYNLEEEKLQTFYRINQLEQIGWPDPFPNPFKVYNKWKDPEIRGNEMRKF